MASIVLTEAATLQHGMFSLTSDDRTLTANLFFRGYSGSTPVEVQVNLDIAAGADLDMSSTPVVNALNSALSDAGYTNP